MDRTYWFIFCSGCIMLKKGQGNQLDSVPCQQEPLQHIKPWTHLQTLPNSFDGTPCKSYIVEKTENIEGYTFVGLRESWTRIPRWQYNMASKAAELHFWNSNTKYCGYCGAPMKWSTDISKKCTNCGKEIWPQVSPAIIVRIKRIMDDGQESILMVHAKNFRRSEMYGLVAGFVETGENLEDCVVREVMEETGIKIQNIKYFGSQAWPYPSGIMIGFTADYLSGDIHLQEEELTDGRWFTRDNMPAIPDKMSIARHLIDDFLNT